MQIKTKKRNDTYKAEKKKRTGMYECNKQPIMLHLTQPDHDYRVVLNIIYKEKKKKKNTYVLGIG